MTRFTSPRASLNLKFRTGGMVAATIMALGPNAFAATPPGPPAAVHSRANGPHPVTPTAGKPGKSAKATVPPNTAAIVNGHVITLSEVTAKAMQEDGSNITANMIDNFLVDSECKKRHIVIPQSMIDERVDGLRKALGPTSLEEGLKQHHETLAQLQEELKQTAEREELVLDKVQPTHMVHCKAILVRFTSENIQQPPDFPPHTEAEALAILANVQKDLKDGKDFGDVAKQYSEDSFSKDKGGEVGLAFDGANIDQALIKAALPLEAGQTTPEPVKVSYGYYIIRVVSTSEKHPADEDASYAAAQDKYRRQQASYMIPEYLKGLRAAAKITNYLP